MSQRRPQYLSSFFLHLAALASSSISHSVCLSVCVWVWVWLFVCVAVCMCAFGVLVKCVSYFLVCFVFPHRRQILISRETQNGKNNLFFGFVYFDSSCILPTVYSHLVWCLWSERAHIYIFPFSLLDGKIPKIKSLKPTTTKSQTFSAC